MPEDRFNSIEECHALLRQVSGQLRSSLGNIYSALQRIAPPEARDADPKVDASAAILCQSYYRILRLAGNLSEAGALDGPSPARLRNDDIVGVCREVVCRAEQPAQLLGLTLELRCEKGSHIIAVDAERLERVLLNLLSNAFKFTPAGGAVRLELRVNPQWVELHVSDTGRGIEPELLETVFDRYLHTRRTDPPPHGLGLGLPISRRIAQEHGGNLLLTSAVGVGTTVTVTLPNRKAPSQTMGALLTDYAGGFNRTLLELSDALPKQAFTQKYLD